MGIEGTTMPRLKDHIFRELVNDLRDISVEWHGSQQLRERISGRLRKTIEPSAFGHGDSCGACGDGCPGDPCMLAEDSPPLPSQGLTASHFGIIDPDYARIYTQARIIAWMYGYSCSAQGSFTRDLDLLLVPWTETAKQNVGQIVTHLASVCDLSIQGEPSEKPHGRKAWTLKLPGFGEVRWVDISAFAPAQQARSES